MWEGLVAAAYDRPAGLTRARPQPWIHNHGGRVRTDTNSALFQSCTDPGRHSRPLSSCALTSRAGYRSLRSSLLPSDLRPSALLATSPALRSALRVDSDPPIRPSSPQVYRGNCPRLPDGVHDRDLRPHEAPGGSHLSPFSLVSLRSCHPFVSRVAHELMGGEGGGSRFKEALSFRPSC